MEVAIGSERRVRCRIVHAFKQIVERPERRHVDRRRSQGGGFAFEQRPRLDQLERADIQLGRDVRRARRVDDIDAGPVACLNQPANFERDHRLADRWAADRMLLGKLALAGQPRTGRISPVGDRRRDPFGDGLVEFARCRFDHDHIRGKKWPDHPSPAFAARQAVRQPHPDQNPPDKPIGLTEALKVGDHFVPLILMFIM
ncbi:hypothetical protein SPHINGOAX6_50454 [Sphingomonas sp. AX6]|nr:hypothetical protein SPHINGOAX6_50454 [Sphingomonas sp. AX6]